MGVKKGRESSRSLQPTDIHIYVTLLGCSLSKHERSKDPSYWIYADTRYDLITDKGKDTLRSIENLGKKIKKKIKSKL